ncbi:MAG: VOC family protein [Thermoleophilia bacterium]|nr:VOC family protein [Thermoleophilia bacterium]
MLARARMEAIVPISDLDRAIDFYGNTLGLELLERREESPDNPEARFRVGERTLAAYKSVGAGQSKHTLAAFVVDDLDATAQQLRERGVASEEYDLPDLRTDNGVASMGETRAAWFRDPDGSILAVAQF